MPVYQFGRGRLRFLALTIPIFTLLNACGTREIGLKTDTWNELRTQQSEIQILTSSQPFLLAYDGRSWRNRWLRFSPLLLSDPLEEIQQQFVSRMFEKSLLGNTSSIQTVHNPLIGRFVPRWLWLLPDPRIDMKELEEQFKTGVIFYFETLHWKLYLPLFIPRIDHPLKLWYRMRASLIHINESRVLWQGVCDAERENSHTDQSTPTVLEWLFADYSRSSLLQEWTKNGNALLQAKRKELASACIEQLTRGFMVGQVKGPDVTDTSTAGTMQP